MEANRCIEKYKEELDKRAVKYEIPNRSEKRKGVIKDWDRDITLEKLANAIDVKDNIVSMERIERRIVENGEIKTVRK